MVLAAVAALACALSACTTTDARLADKGVTSPPAPGSKVLLVEPDVQLSLLTASGVQQERADWSRQGRDGLREQIAAAMSGRSHPILPLDPDASMTGRTGQLLRLNEAVGRSIQSFNYGAIRLPSKRGPFDWTLGDGAVELGRERGADYALFVNGRGSYASSGRVALMLGAALLGASVPLGSQAIYASLVDLRTGRVVWFNMALAGPNADIRTAEGARALTAALLKGAPL